MKTQLQYPNGLSITIEHDEQFAPQVLEVKEAVSSDELAAKNAELVRKNKDLHNLIEKFEFALVKLETENSDLRIELKKFRPENNNNKIHKEKSGPMFSVRKCTKCGKMFQPNGPRGNTCTQCKAELSSLPDEKTETPE